MDCVLSGTSLCVAGTCETWREETYQWTAKRGVVGQVMRAEIASGKEAAATAAADVGCSLLLRDCETRRQLQQAVGLGRSFFSIGFGLPGRLFPLERHGSRRSETCAMMEWCGHRREVAACLLHQKLSCRWRHKIDDVGGGLFLLQAFLPSMHCCCCCCCNLIAIVSVAALPHCCPCLIP
jgi:hypothetical protein